MTRLKASLRRGNRCKLLHLGSSFWHPIVVDATPQMTSNVDAFRKATVRHVLREVPLGPLVILRPALLLCPGPRGAPVQRRRPKHANRSHPGTLLDASWWRSGRLRRAGRFTTFEQQLGARALLSRKSQSSQGQSKFARCEGVAHTQIYHSASRCNLRTPRRLDE